MLFNNAFSLGLANKIEFDLETTMAFKYALVEHKTL
jgi:hypothetical protein